MEVDNLLQSFTEKRILVVGDMMIDAYLKGSVTRVSPEAPVPIVNFHAKEDRLGGAANVALNLRALGAQAILCAVIGKDENSVRMTQIMEEHELSTDGIIHSDQRMTTVKTRVIGNNQQLVRIDSEDSSDITSTEEDALIERISNLLTEQRIDAIILEDYNKGVLTEKVIRATVQLAQEKNIPTTVDPKKKNFFAYENVTLFKPNLKELKEGLDVQFNFSERHKFEAAVDELRTKLNCKKTFITLSENGVFIQEKDEKTTSQHTNVTLQM